MADASKTLTVVITAKDEASKTLQSFAGSLGNLIDKAKLGSTIIAGALGLAAKSAIQTGVEFEQARIAFETFLGSGQKAGKLLKDLSDFAVKTPFNLPQVVEGARGLLAYGVSAEKIIPTFRMLGDLSSGSSVKLDRLTLAFGQVKAATYLTGQELRQFTEAGVPMLDQLAKQFHVTTGEMRDMISDRAVKFGDVEKALESLTSKGGRFFNNMANQSKTLGGILSNTKDEMTRFVLGVLGFSMEGEIRKGSIFYYLKEGAAKFLEFLTSIRPAVQSFIENLMANMPAVVAMFGALVGLLIPIIAAFIGLIAPALVLMAIFAAIGLAVGLLISVIQQFGPAIMNSLMPVWTFLSGVFAPVWEVIRAALTKVWEQIQLLGPSFQQLGAALAQLMPFISALVTILTAAFTALLTAVVAVITGIITGFTTMLPFIVMVIQGIIDFITGFINFMVGMFQGNMTMVIEGVKQMFQGMYNFIVGVLGALIGFISGFIAGVIALFQGLFNQLVGNIVPALANGVFNIIKTAMIDRIISAVTSFASNFIGIIRGAANAAIAAFNAITGAINAVIGAMNNLISKAREVAGAVAGGLHIPGFQHGGFVPGGYGQAVPAILHGGERVVPRVGTDVNGGGGGGGGGMSLTINITGPVSMDSNDRVQELADQIISVLGRQNELASKGISI